MLRPWLRHRYSKKINYHYLQRYLIRLEDAERSAWQKGFCNNFLHGAWNHLPNGPHSSSAEMLLIQCGLGLTARSCNEHATSSSLHTTSNPLEAHLVLKEAAGPGDVDCFLSLQLCIWALQQQRSQIKFCILELSRSPSRASLVKPLFNVPISS